jgi:hypothetical protein
LKEKYIVLNFHPLVFFYLFGVVTVLISIIFGLYSIHLHWTDATEIFVIRGGLSLLMFLMGSLFLLFAMLFDMEQEKNIGW